MFLLLLAVPALLVVVTGYAIGYGLWTWVGGRVDAAFGTSLAGGAEVAGWLTGALALAAVLGAAVVLRRRRRWPRRRPG